MCLHFGFRSGIRVIVRFRVVVYEGALLLFALQLSMIHAELDAMNRALADMEEGLTNNNNNIVGLNSTNRHSILGNTFSHQVIDDYNVMVSVSWGIQSPGGSDSNIIIISIPVAVIIWGMHGSHKRTILTFINDSILQSLTCEK